MQIPEVAALWNRWATLAAALSAVGFDDVWTVGDAGAHHDDHGGNWAHLALVEGGRAVFYGYDHEYSDTVTADPPIDLLAGAPDWIPWAELTRLAAEDQLGYLYWHDGGGWERAPYDEADGLTSTAGAVLDDEAALAELVDFVLEWGEHEPADALDEQRLRDAAAALLDAGARREVDDRVLRAYPSRLVGAGIAVAAAGGISPGTHPPVLPAGQRPERRRVRRLSDRDHDRLVWSAMKETAELDRPAPLPTPALDDLVAWLRARAPGGRCSLIFYMTEHSSGEQHGEHPRGDDSLDSFREVGDLVRAVRREEGDSGHGSWLFLRIETTSSGATVERRYDSWPPWWEDNGYSGPGRDELRAELEKRGPARWPEWAALLSPDVAYQEI